jgi:hypothetical protein
MLSYNMLLDNTVLSDKILSPFFSCKLHTLKKCSSLSYPVQFYNYLTSLIKVLSHFLYYSIVPFRSYNVVKKVFNKIVEGAISEDNPEDNQMSPVMSSWLAFRM